MKDSLPQHIKEQLRKMSLTYPWLMFAKVKFPDGTVLRKVNDWQDTWYGETGDNAYDDSDYLGHWKCDDNIASTAVVDSGPNSKDCTIQGGSNSEDISVKSPPGTGHNYPGGASDYASLAAGNGMSVGTSDFAVAFWFRIDPGTAINYIFQVTDAGKGWYVGLDDSGNKNKIKAWINDDNNVSAVYSTTDDLRDGQWHHCAVNFDRDGDATIYLDGAKDNEGDISTSGASLVDGPVRIGYRVVGSVSDVRYVSGRLWKEDEITAIYNAIPVSGCVGWWPLGENDGLVAYDWSGNQANGTISEDASGLTVAGKPRRAFLCDGNQLITIPHHPRYSAHGGGTWSFWFKTTESSVNYPDDNNSREWAARVNADGSVSFYIFDDIDRTYYCRVTSSTGYNDDAWHHAIITWNGDVDATMSGMNIYIDNISDKDSASKSASWTRLKVSDAPLRLLAQPDGNYPVDGTVCDIRIFDHVITSAQREEIYNNDAGSLDQISSTLGRGTFSVPHEYGNFAFNIDPIKIASDESIPSTKINFQNISRFLYPTIWEQDIADGSEIELSLASAKYLMDGHEQLSMLFDLLEGVLDSQVASFTLSVPNLLVRRASPKDYKSYFCGWEYRSVECGYTISGFTVDGITLSGTDPVSVRETNHIFSTGDSVILTEIVGITPSLNGTYVITKVNADDFTLDGTDSSDYTGSWSSGGRVSHTSCKKTLSDCRQRSQQARFGAEIGTRRSGITLV